MIDRDSPVTEEELHAFVDGELPADRMEAVTAWLAEHADQAALVASWRSQADSIRARYGAVAGEPESPPLLRVALNAPPIVINKIIIIKPKVCLGEANNSFDMFFIFSTCAEKSWLFFIFFWSQDKFNIDSIFVQNKSPRSDRIAVLYIGKTVI